jgi:predicted 3-demethylubiquinone-9 3-methyltransferase (glyoxalase superfamily)
MNLSSSHRIQPCLWFDGQAEAAAALYVATFPNSRVLQLSRYPEAGTEIHGQEPGSVMTVGFELDGLRFTALNGGPLFRFNEAVSLQVHCATQQEIDHYWFALGAGGDPAAQQCGWLKDRFGLSWQILPMQLGQWMAEAQVDGRERAMAALLQMRKLDIAMLQRAFSGH